MSKYNVDLHVSEFGTQKYVSSTKEWVNLGLFVMEIMLQPHNYNSERTLFIAIALVLAMKVHRGDRREVFHLANCITLLLRLLDWVVTAPSYTYSGFLSHSSRGVPIRMVTWMWGERRAMFAKCHLWEPKLDEVVPAGAMSLPDSIKPYTVHTFDESSNRKAGKQSAQ